MILSLLYRLSPEQCRFLMIDPKMLELSVYNGIPHLLARSSRSRTRRWPRSTGSSREMEERYRRMAQLSVRNIDVFNTRVRSAESGEQLSRTVQTGFDRTGEAITSSRNPAEPMPYIVVVVDEFADLMLVAGKEIEAAVQRLAQMARAAGIHLIMATQRPRSTSSPAPSRPTSRRASASRSPPRSTAAPSSTSRAPSSCWARATCCSRPARGRRCACTGRSSRTRRWRGSPAICASRASRATSTASAANAGPEVGESAAAGRSAAAISTIARSPSCCASARRPPATCSAGSPSATTVPPT